MENSKQSAHPMEKATYVRVARLSVSVPVEGKLTERSYPAVEVHICGMTLTKQFRDEWDLTFAIKLSRSHGAPLEVEPEFQEMADLAAAEVDRMAIIVGSAS